MWGDILTAEEARCCQKILIDLAGVTWAHSLLDRIHHAGGVKYENKPLLFELRFAWELHRLGLSVSYEYQAGVGNSTVDFRISGVNAEWLIELVSLQPSEAVKGATRQEGVVTITEISSDSSDPKQSEEAEMIRAQEKIVDKVFSRGIGPIKFPTVQPGRYQVIVCDMRGYLIGGGDYWDYRHIAYGRFGIPLSVRFRQMLIRYWRGPTGRPEPIKGLFEESNPNQGAQTLQERIHFLGFVNEKKYHEGSIQDYSCYMPNWHLFKNDSEVKPIFDIYPMRKLSKDSK